ncbi:siroheme synthase [Sphingobium sp. DEHP117]|uniref:precorrin-2 dehydrogenase/sirohydrochlorin ferrochelatase family protein n=1 Tax=Sphingobium sp. DEHP117 TaxID=2993436 RepID=UPI0027D4CCAB|nr:NAD(P)-dependent oxidoreductase [Sphingobium sp. DEHP117]MDQ4421070.1 siroheme synthase [Sphingobium sp. DEHP117]
MHSLPLFVKLDGRLVILLGEGEAADAKRRLLERAGADVHTDETAQAALAIVAMEDDAQAQAAVARLRARGVLVNAVDRPALCDFTLPAIVDRDPVLIAISTGGASAGLAKALRQRLEALFPASLGSLARALSSARAGMRSRWPDAAARRRAIDDALAEGGVLDPLAGAREEAVVQWLSQAGGGHSATRLETIPVVSEDPDDLTLRAARLLGQADAVYHMPGIAPAILNRARADAARIVALDVPQWEGPGLALWLFRAEDQA